MKVIATQAAILTNYEVLKHITNVRERYADHPDYVKPVTSKDTRGKQTTARLTGLWNVVENTHHYLTRPQLPHSQPDATYSETSYRGLMQRLKPFGLTKPELINIINMHPHDGATLDVCIEELELRMDDDVQEQVLEIIREELGEYKPMYTGKGGKEGKERNGARNGGQGMDVDG